MARRSRPHAWVRRPQTSPRLQAVDASLPCSRLPIGSQAATCSALRNRLRDHSRWRAYPPRRPPFQRGPVTEKRDFRMAHLFADLLWGQAQVRKCGRCPLRRSATAKSGPIVRSAGRKRHSWRHTVLPIEASASGLYCHRSYLTLR